MKLVPGAFALLLALAMACGAAATTTENTQQISPSAATVMPSSAAADIAEPSTANETPALPAETS
ncbi:MAG: M48 family peptidase, partial [Chloroflexota bacterium]|nr:M48 family peptidase [Chloroflexota bacterium]